MRFLILKLAFISGALAWGLNALAEGVASVGPDAPVSEVSLSSFVCAKNVEQIYADEPTDFFPTLVYDHNGPESALEWVSPDDELFVLLKVSEISLNQGRLTLSASAGDLNLKATIPFAEGDCYAGTHCGSGEIEIMRSGTKQNFALTCDLLPSN